MITGKEEKEESFVTYHPFPKFFEKPGHKMNTLEFAQDLRQASQTFKCGIIFPVSMRQIKKPNKMTAFLEYTNDFALDRLISKCKI